jgi:hypothetical protein
MATSVDDATPMFRVKKDRVATEIEIKKSLLYLRNSDGFVSPLLGTDKSDGDGLVPALLDFCLHTLCLPKLPCATFS